MTEVTTSNSTNNVETTEKKENKPTLNQILEAEIRDLAHNAVVLKREIDTAKTSYKKKYFSRKLKKNNDEAVKLLMALEKLQQLKR